MRKSILIYISAISFLFSCKETKPTKTMKVEPQFYYTYRLNVPAIAGKDNYMELNNGENTITFGWLNGSVSCLKDGTEIGKTNIQSASKVYFQVFRSDDGKVECYYAKEGDILEKLCQTELNYNQQAELNIFGDLQAIDNDRYEVPSESTQFEEEKITCNLEILDLNSGKREIILTKHFVFEAPNWSKDGKYLLINSGGKLYRVPLENPEMIEINTEDINQLNNDHGISPDGTRIAMSHNLEGKGSTIYVAPIDGGTPKRITDKAPSYWHGWSPDGKTLAFVGARDGNYDIYTIPADGSGEERRLTTTEGLDDGPDYSPDGEYIYFNSERDGNMHIWRMDPDGENQTELTHGKYRDWFAHPSPDGKSIVFLSFMPDVAPGNHPPNQKIMLRLMPTDLSEKPRVLAHLYGGQGTINVPSWSPDSKKIAFVSYQYGYNE